MHDPLKMLEALAVRARQETAPCGNVSLEAIYRMEGALVSPVAPLTIFAAASAVVAAVILVFLAAPVSTSGASLDALSAFFQVASLQI